MLVNTIPGVLFDPLREGAYEVSRDVAEAIDHGEDLRVCRARLDGICRLLDVIGWTCEHPATDSEVAFTVHAGALRASVGVMLLLMSGWEEPECYEALRDFAATELPGLCGAADTVCRCRHVAEGCAVCGGREGGRGSLGRVLERAAWRLARFARTLDGLRALFDEIGWGSPERQRPVEIDLGVHGPLLADVMENDLEIQRYLADTDDVSQRECAAANVVMIEGVLADLQGMG